VITSPADGTHFSLTPITVEGTCVIDYRVVLYRNGVISGSGICKGDGTFSIKSDLSYGRNEFKARQYDLVDQASPESNTVVVFLDRPAVIIGPGGVTIQPFTIRTDTPYQVGNPGDEFIWPIEVLGGQAPYAISWNWGDGSVDVISLPGAGPYKAKHVYTKPGEYRIIIKGSDALGQTAYLELLAVVKGDPGIGATRPSGWFDGGLLLILWPLYILMLAMLLSFWLGERYEFYKVKQRLLNPSGPYQNLQP
jgi:hypothetical protein